MRERSSAILVWGSWVVLAGLQLFVGWSYGADTPLGDEWALVPMAEGRDLSLEELWAAHGRVHRIPLPRLAYYALMEAAGWRFRVPPLLNAGLLAVLAAAWILAARRMRGRTVPEDLFLALVLLHGGMVFQVLFSFQLTFLAGTLLWGLLLAAVVGGRLAELPPWLPSAVGLCALALPLTGANGALLATPLVAWIAAWCVREVRRGGWSGATAVSGALALASAALLAAYPRGLAGDVASELEREAASVARTAAEFAGSSLGTAGAATAPFSGIALLAAVLLLGARLARTVVAAPLSRWRALALLALAAGPLTVALGVGLGRPGGTPIRYAVLAAPIAAWIYLASARVAGSSGRGRVLGSALLGVLLVGQVWDVSAGRGYATWQAAARRHFVEEVRSGPNLPVRLRARLVREHSGEPWHVHPAEGAFGRRLEVLQRAGIGPFRNQPDLVRPARVLLFVAQGAAAAAGPGPELEAILERGVLFATVRLPVETRRWLLELSGGEARDRSTCVPAELGSGAPLRVVRLGGGGRPGDLGAEALRCQDGCLPALAEAGDTLFLWLEFHRGSATRPRLRAAWPPHPLGSVTDTDRLDLDRFLHTVLGSAYGRVRAAGSGGSEPDGS